MSAKSELQDILLAESRRVAVEFIRSKRMRAGANGSYGDPETPLRNTAHWLYSFCRSYVTSGDGIFKEAAELSSGQLRDAISLFNGSVNVRLSSTKDSSNGVLGQAHLIEGLWCAWTSLGDNLARDVALSLADRHPFDHRNKCWHRISPTGKAMSPDFTFNHQLYYAAVIAFLREDSSHASSTLNCFLAGLDDTFLIYADGFVKHNIPNRSTPSSLAKHFVAEAKRTRFGSKRSKEYNYHTYNMYAFALLQEAGVQLPAGSQDRWSRAATLLKSEALTKRTSRASWGGPLASGSETICADFAYFSRLNDDESHEAYLRKSADFLKFHAGPNLDYTLFSPDPHTQAARLYRYWRAL